MPELPEVETVRRGLARVAVGRRIVGITVRYPKVVAVGPGALSPTRRTSPAVVRAFRRGLVGRRVVAVERRGKLLQLRLSGTHTLAVHLKITGQFIAQRVSERTKAVPWFNAPGSRPVTLPHRHTHVTLALSDGGKLHYNDLRRFGYLRFIEDADLPQVIAEAAGGVEPLSRAFTSPRLSDILDRAPNAPVKAVILDQRRIAGIGNIYADEILFCARIRPTRTSKSLTKAERTALYRAVRPVLAAAIRAHGSSIGDFFAPDGTPGTYGARHWVYGRAGQPCRRCGSRLVRTVVRGRGTVYCPRCQA